MTKVMCEDLKCSSNINGICSRIIITIKSGHDGDGYFWPYCEESDSTHELDN